MFQAKGVEKITTHIL